jgi:hypothetical protein
MAARTRFENLQVYKLGEKLADEIWTVVSGWDHFAKSMVGRQMVCAADSVCRGLGKRKFPGQSAFCTNGPRLTEGDPTLAKAGVSARFVKYR